MSHAKVDSRLLALIVASAQFMAALDGSVIAIALPHMATDFHASPVDLSIGITAYMLVQAALLPSCSWVADRFGARTVFVLAIIGFIVSSMLCGMSGSLAQFVAARVLQGACGAMMTPVGRIVVFQATEKKDLVSVVTISTVPMLFAPTIGPPLGGFIVTYLSWPWIFFLNAPIGVLGVLASLRFIPNLMPQGRRPFDLKGFVLTGVAIVGLLNGLHEMGNGAGYWAFAGALFLGGLVTSVWAVQHIERHATPIISFRAMRFPNFRICRINGPLAQAPFQMLNFILPLMLQVNLGLNAFVTGTLLLAMSAGDLVIKMVTGWILRVFGFRNVIWIGVVTFAATVMACGFFTRHTPLWVIFAVLAVNGMIRSALFSAIMTLNYTDVPQEEMGAASVLNSIIMQVSGAASISFAALVLNLSSAFSPGPHTLTLNDCRFALGAATILCLSSLIGFRRLHPHVGAEVIGYRQQKPAVTAPGE
jgi:EmrB/QacA subfamily drug resistance transporter